MNIWDVYETRISASGHNKRDAALKREEYILSQKIRDSLSSHTVLVDGAEADVAIINTDTLSEKNVCCLQKDIIKAGSMISWSDNFWIVTERDAGDEVYTKAKMKQCNFLLKWIDSEGKMHEQWCVIEDGTKYLVGEYEDRNFVVTRGDTRIAMTITRNEYTKKFNRSSRFLIDDPSEETKLSYQLTKPLKVSQLYGDEGVYVFVLQETQSTDNDNHEIGIADYYKYFPKPDTSPTITPGSMGEVRPDNKDETGRQVWF